MQLKHLLVFAVALSLSALTQAQVLEEVVVTAQKREQSLSDVGISVTAFSGDQLKALGFSNTTQFDEQVPGLMVTDYGGGVTTVFNIRGSQQLDFGDQQEPPVAVYSDGVYNSYLAGVGFSFFDLERIEVLRGPQGTLFGRNATGGLVHIISAKPTRELEGYVELEGGEYGHFRTEAAISGPLTESLAGRVSIFHENNSGYVDQRNPALPDTLQTDNLSGRAQLLFEPSDKYSVLLAARYSTDDIPGTVYNVERSAIDVGGLPGLPGDGFILNDVNDAQLTAFCGALAGINGVPTFPAAGAINCFGSQEDSDPYSVEANTEGYYRRTQLGFSLTAEADIGFGTVTYIADWQDFEKDYLEDTDSSAFQLFDFFQDMESNQWSQELRLAGETDRTRWVVGAYYLQIDSSYRVGVDGQGSGVPGAIDEFGALAISLDNRYTLNTRTWAFFGQLEYDFSPQFTGIAGFRWTEDRKGIKVDPICSANPALGLPGLNNFNCQVFFGPADPANFVQGAGLPKTKRSEGDWSGHLELDWRPNDDYLVYGKITRGHKAGGFNSGGTLFFTPAQAEFDSETPLSYEIGFKGEFFGGKARFNAAGFYIDYNDFQTFVQNGLSLVLFNVDAEVLGMEAELITNPWEGWEFLFGLSLLDAEQKDVEGPPGITSRNRPMPNSPDVTFNALGRYEFAAFGGRMALQMDAQYVDSRTLNGIDHPSLSDGSYFVANASGTWTSASDKWQLRLGVTNFTDEYYVPTAFDLAGISGSTIYTQPPPRWVKGTISYRF